MQYKTQFLHMASYDDLNRQWGVANEIMNQIEDFGKKLIKQDQVKKKTRQYHRTNKQLKKELELLLQRCRKWTTGMQTCAGQLSDRTIKYLKLFEGVLEDTENTPPREGDELKQDISHDLHRIEKGITTVFKNEKVSIGHLSTDMNPYIICPTQSICETCDVYS